MWRSCEVGALSWPMDVIKAVAEGPVIHIEAPINCSDSKLIVNINRLNFWSFF